MANVKEKPIARNVAFLWAVYSACLNEKPFKMAEQTKAAGISANARKALVDLNIIIETSVSHVYSWTAEGEPSPDMARQVLDYNTKVKAPEKSADQQPILKEHYVALMDRLGELEKQNAALSDLVSKVIKILAVQNDSIANMRVKQDANAEMLEKQLTEILDVMTKPQVAAG